MEYSTSSTRRYQIYRWSNLAPISDDIVDGPIQPKIAIKDVPIEPDKLPVNYEWCVIDIFNEHDVFDEIQTIRLKVSTIYY